MLDIVVPHADESWPVCRRFFDLLRAQLRADLSRVRVQLVHDGSLPWPEDYVAVPGLAVEQLRIPKGGVSAARNAGLDAGSGEWVMFCDCDDMFANVFSLHCILDALSRQEASRDDLLWFPFYVETLGGRDVCTLNWIFVHGKIYRRAFLKKKRLRFPEGLYYGEDSAFNAMVEMDIDRDRIGEIRSECVLYVWALNPRSVTSRPENQLRNALGLMDRHAVVAEELRRRGRDGDALALVARTAWDAYFLWFREDLGEKNREAVRLRLKTVCGDFPRLAERLGSDRMSEIGEASRKECVRKGAPDLPPDGFGPWFAEVMG